MIRLYSIYLVLFLISSCCTEKKSRSETVEKLLNSTPILYDIPIDSIPTGINLNFDNLNFDLPIKDTIGKINLKNDTALVIKFTDTVRFFLIKEDYQWAIKLLKKQAETNEELKKFLDDRRFGSDLELLDYIYKSSPKDNKPNTELIMDIKEILMPLGGEKGIYKIRNPLLKGYQYCIGNECKTIASDIYIGGTAYKIIAIGFSQEVFHKILGSIKLGKKSPSP